MRTFVSLFFLSVSSIAACFSASIVFAEEALLPVNEVVETESALFFIRSDYKDFISFTPKTDTQVTCLESVDSGLPLHCSMILKLKEVRQVPAPFPQSVPVFYGVTVGNTADDECKLKSVAQESAIITALKKHSRQILAARGNTFTDPTADVCRFDFALAGQKEKRIEVLTELKKQAKDRVLIVSPLSIALALRVHVGDSLLRSFQSFGLDEVASQSMPVTEAAFLIGAATALDSSLFARFKEAEPETRRKYIEMALNALFEVSKDKAVMRSTPSLPSFNNKVYFEKTTHYSL